MSDERTDAGYTDRGPASHPVFQLIPTGAPLKGGGGRSAHYIQYPPTRGREIRLPSTNNWTSQIQDRRRSENVEEEQQHPSRSRRTYTHARPLTHLSSQHTQSSPIEETISDRHPRSSDEISDDEQSEHDTASLLSVLSETTVTSLSTSVNPTLSECEDSDDSQGCTFASMGPADSSGMRSPTNTSTLMGQRVGQGNANVTTPTDLDADLSPVLIDPHIGSGEASIYLELQPPDELSSDQHMRHFLNRWFPNIADDNQDPSDIHGAVLVPRPGETPMFTQRHIDLNAYTVSTELSLPPERFALHTIDIGVQKRSCVANVPEHAAYVSHKMSIDTGSSTTWIYDRDRQPDTSNPPFNLRYKDGFLQRGFIENPIVWIHIKPTGDSPQETKKMYLNLLPVGVTGTPDTTVIGPGHQRQGLLGFAPCQYLDESSTRNDQSLLKFIWSSDNRRLYFEGDNKDGGQFTLQLRSKRAGRSRLLLGGELQNRVLWYKVENRHWWILGGVNVELCIDGQSVHQDNVDLLADSGSTISSGPPDFIHSIYEKLEAKVEYETRRVWRTIKETGLDPITGNVVTTEREREITEYFTRPLSGTAGFSTQLIIRMSGGVTCLNLPETFWNFGRRETHRFDGWNHDLQAQFGPFQSNVNKTSKCLTLGLSVLHYIDAHFRFNHGAHHHSMGFSSRL